MVYLYRGLHPSARRNDMALLITMPIIFIRLKLSPESPRLGVGEGKGGEIADPGTTLDTIIIQRKMSPECST